MLNNALTRSMKGSVSMLTFVSPVVRYSTMNALMPLATSKSIMAVHLDQQDKGIKGGEWSEIHALKSLAHQVGNNSIYVSLSRVNESNDAIQWKLYAMSQSTLASTYR